MSKFSKVSIFSGLNNLRDITLSAQYGTLCGYTEDVSHEGQCDLTVKHAGIAWVFEFKVVDGDQGTGEALRQLQARNYAAKYRGAPGIERVIEVGVEFSRTRRQVVGWDVRAR
ncbi:PD-(D/E)XK nuclease domain-containing protein [Tepidimonas aquatica]|uniref:PD-(D/E)XK nuclease domain-containing protein n=1 Tax=Tepidimonas aquatica TaxID=247482 RepID=UPI001FE7701F|nr:PD-(D/E)XK nuclease domain-containing protein [Tepidimonas aquatica]